MRAGTALHADLHVHTTASDGLASPEAVAREASRIGLGAIAITDHDTIDGIAGASTEGARLGLRVVPALEMSAWVGTAQVHVLAYFVDTDDETLTDHLRDLGRTREQRAGRIVDRLNERGVLLGLDDVTEEARGGRLGRAHIARVLVKNGHAVDLRDAFVRYLGRSGCCYVPRAVSGLEDVISFLAGLGAVPVIAHPGVERLKLPLRRLKGLGLCGIEYAHPEHSRTQRAYWRATAASLGLVATGGSDWHGGGDSQAMPLGCVSVPLRRVDELERRRRPRKRGQAPPPLEWPT
jgi:hypothetical protein